MTIEQYSETKERIRRLKAWLGNRCSYKPEEVPAELAVTNEERSAVEVYEFTHDPPANYFLYVNEKEAKATTWTGDLLGKASFGQEYKCPAFGRCSVRVPITISAINGRTYHGTYFKSSGDYARVRISK